MSSDVRGLVCVIGVMGGQNIEQVEFGTNGCHEAWVGAEDFIEVADDADVATPFFAFC